MTLDYAFREGFVQLEYLPAMANGDVPFTIVSSLNNIKVYETSLGIIVSELLEGRSHKIDMDMIKKYGVARTAIAGIDVTEALEALTKPVLAVAKNSETPCI